MADNGSTLTDADGDYSDWIEIYDPCLPTVNLDGWYLTDDPEDLTKWRFPAVSARPRRHANGLRLREEQGRPRRAASHELQALGQRRVPRAGEAGRNDDRARVLAPVPASVPGRVVRISADLRDAVGPRGDGGVSRPHQRRRRAWGRAGRLPDSTTRRGRPDRPAWDTRPPARERSRSPTTRPTSTSRISRPPRRSPRIPRFKRPSSRPQPATINYLNTGASAHFGGDLPFPGHADRRQRRRLRRRGDGRRSFCRRRDRGRSASTATTASASSSAGSRACSRRRIRPLAGRRTRWRCSTSRSPGRTRCASSSYERGGGSELELFAAQGSFSSFSSAFRLVGDTSGGGLAVDGLSQLIGTDVRAVMQGVNASLWSRMPFDVPNPGAVDLLTLRMAYEDGFVAFLNGVEVARRNAPPDVPWDAAAASDRPGGRCGGVRAHRSVGLHGESPANGTNVLAVHGLNDDAGGRHLPGAPRGDDRRPDVHLDARRISPRRRPDTTTARVIRAFRGTRSSRGRAGCSAHTFSLELTRGGSRRRDPLHDGRKPADGDARHASTRARSRSSDSTRVRARVFEAGFAPGQVITRSYIKLAAELSGFSSNLPIVVVDTFGGGITQEFLAETLTSVIPTTGGRASITDATGFVVPAGLRIRGSSPRRRSPRSSTSSRSGTRAAATSTCRSWACPRTPIGFSTRPTPTRR